MNTERNEITTSVYAPDGETLLPFLIRVVEVSEPNFSAQEDDLFKVEVVEIINLSSKQPDKNYMIDIECAVFEKYGNKIELNYLAELAPVKTPMSLFKINW